LFFEVGCYAVATEFGNVATGNGHDHISQAQGQLDGLHGADTDQSGWAHSLSGKPNLRPQAGPQAWIKRRETELAEPGAIERANRKDVTIRKMIEQYLESYEKIRPLGKTKNATFRAIKDTWLGDLDDSALTSQKLVEFAQWRMSKEGGGVQAQTVGNDLSHLGAMLSVARPAWGYEVDPLAMPDSRKAQIDMPKVIAFALFSTRRQEEITRIRWDDLDDSRHAVLVRDMKNPGQKIGNDVWCHLPYEAWAILQSMPKVEREIFPYNAKSVSASFTRACPMLGIEDLHFHDLRHEGVSRLVEMDWDIPRCRVFRVTEIGTRYDDKRT